MRRVIGSVNASATSIDMLHVVRGGDAQAWRFAGQMHVVNASAEIDDPD
jgi:hypothetical protein